MKILMLLGSSKNLIASHIQVDTQELLAYNFDGDTQSSRTGVLMKESSHSSSWGGYRPGAGQKPKWRNGTTVTIRVPQVLIEDVMRYAQLVDGQSPGGLKAEDCLSCILNNDT
jgi:hypothetical protein